MSGSLSLVLDRGKGELHRIHDISCGENDTSLNRHLQRQWFYWHEMARDAAEIHVACM